MRITFAHLCDYALLSKEGKLSVLGIFSGINCRDLPWVHPQAYLAFEIELNHAEANKPFEVRIECVDADGRKLFGAEAELAVQGPSQIGNRPRFHQVLGLSNLRFDRSGAHEFNIFLQGKLEHQLSFEVVVARPDPPKIEAPGVRPDE